MRGRPSAAACITAGVVAVLIAAPLAFGAVTPGVLASIELAVFVLGAAALVVPKTARAVLDPRLSTPLDVPLVMLLGLGLMQLIPLPPAVVGVLSPGKLAWLADLGLETDRWLPLSMYPYATWLAVLRIGAAAVLFWLVTRLFTTTGRVRAMLVALTTLGLFEAAYGLGGYVFDPARILGMQRGAPFDAVTGTFINPNHFAGLIELLLPASVAFYLGFVGPGGSTAADRWARHTVALGAASVMAVALVCSRSQTALAISAAALLMTCVAAMPGRRGAAATIVIAASAAVLLVGDSAAALLAGAAAGRLDRLAYWHDGVAMAIGFPITGTGLGTWEAVFPIFKTFPAQTTIAHAHNDYLEILAEGGVPGLALFLVILCRLGATLVRGAVAATSRERTIIVALGTGLALLAVHGLADFNFQIPSNLYLFFAVAGLAIVVARDPSVIPRTPTEGSAHRSASGRATTVLGRRRSTRVH